MNVPVLRHPDRVLDAARHELQAAGNPAYAVALLDDDGHAELSPMIFARREPAVSFARQLADLAPGDDIVVIARDEAARRASFTVYDSSASYKLYSRTEVVEATLADDDSVAGSD